MKLSCSAWLQNIQGVLQRLPLDPSQVIHVILWGDRKDRLLDEAPLTVTGLVSILARKASVLQPSQYGRILGGDVSPLKVLLLQ